MRAPEEFHHFQYDEDGLLGDSLLPVAWDPARDACGDHALRGPDVFGPVTQKDLPPTMERRALRLPRTNSSGANGGVARAGAR
jgi:hypothetical protein